MIKAIIFDIGNVLKRFEYKEHLQKLFPDCTTRDKIYSAIWGTGYWKLLDLGEDSDSVFAKMTAAEPDYKSEIKLTLETIGDCMYRQDYAIPWIKELKSRGFAVYYLSNYSDFVKKASPEVLDFLPYTDGGIFSCDVKMMKPDLRIYRLLLEKYDLKAEECIFIDDRMENVEAAIKCGMEAIHFTDYLHSRENMDTIIMRNY